MKNTQKMVKALDLLQQGFDLLAEAVGNEAAQTVVAHLKWDTESITRQYPSPGPGLSKGKGKAGSLRTKEGQQKLTDTIITIVHEAGDTGIGMTDIQRHPKMVALYGGGEVPPQFQKLKKLVAAKALKKAGERYHSAK